MKGWEEREGRRHWRDKRGRKGTKTWRRDERGWMERETEGGTVLGKRGRKGRSGGRGGKEGGVTGHKYLLRFPIYR